MSTPHIPDGFEIRSWPLQSVFWLWALPGSCIGLAVGLLGLLTGGHVQRVGPTLEFCGGLVTRLLQSRGIRARGMTLGHVIIGASISDLESVRTHEWVHIRQYERWGPFFIPAYLTCSLVLYARGRNGYWENPFEVEAYAADRSRSTD